MRNHRRATFALVLPLACALAAQDAPVPSAAEANVLRGTVLLPDGAPAASAAIELHRFLLRDTSALDPEHSRVAQQTLRATCDARGNFQVELPPGLPFELRAAAGKAVEAVRRAFAGQTLQVRLRRAAMLEGVVTRAADGKAVPAEVRAWASVSGVEILRGRTDASGHFFFAQLLPDAITLEVQPAEGKEPGWARLVLTEGRTLRHDVKIEDGESVQGRVLDARTQRPIAGADVSDGWRFDRAVRTDAEGRFTLRAAEGDELHARAPGYGKRCVPGGNGQDIALEPGRRARGTIVDAAGKPLAGVYVAATAEATIDDRPQTDWLSVFTAPDGTFAFDRVRRDVPHCLFLRCDGRATLVYDFPADEETRDEIDFGSITLPAAIHLTGRVLDENGRPIEGAPVALGGAQHDRYRYCDGKQAKEPRGGFYVNGRNTVTDDLGRFHFADLGVGSYRLRARVEQVTPRLVGSSVIETDTVTVNTTGQEQVVHHDFTIKLGRTLRGRVMTASGTAPPMVSVRFGPTGGSLSTATLLVQTGVPFRLFQLPAGALTIEATPCDFHGNPLAATDGPLTATRDLGAGAGDPVWICLPEPRWVQAFVVDAAGQPVAGAKVSAAGASGTELGERVTDARGSVIWFLGEEAAAHLVVQALPGSDGAPLRPAAIAAGTANLVLVRR